MHRAALGADGMDLFAAGAADMDFAAAPAVLKAMRTRAAHGMFGHETAPEGLSAQAPRAGAWTQAISCARPMR